LGSLWFAPSDIHQKISFSPVNAVYIPYWIYSGNTVSTYSGLVCHYDKQPESKKRIERWHTASGQQHGTYNNVMVCADTEQNSIIMEQIASFGDWNLSKATLNQPQGGMEVKLDRYLQHASAWTKASSLILKREEGFCMTKLQRDERSEKIQDFVLKSVQFVGLSQRLVYLPVYISSYVYGGTEYRIVISGQTGVIQGQRPYGLGKLGSAIGSLGGIVFGKGK